MVNILNLINAFSSFSIFLILWIKLKQNYILKCFASLSIGNMGISHFLYALIDVLAMYHTQTLKIYIHLLVLYLITFNYLYFKYLFSKELKINKNDIIKLIICTLFFVVLVIEQDNKFIEWEFEKYIIFAIVTIYSFFYLLKIYLLLYRNIWGKEDNSINGDIKNKSYNTHLKYIFILIILVVFRDLQGIAMDTGICSSKYCQINILFLLLIISAAQLTVFFRSLLNPEILYGKEYLTTIIERQNIRKLQDIWTIGIDSNILNQQDKKIEQNVAKNILKYISILEGNKKNDALFKNPNYNIKDLSNDLCIQKSHLSFIFKYHCKLSFSSYKKLIQIKEAKRLLDSNYLVNNTIEALSAEVGFSSYSPFYTNFKKYTGMSPQEYYTRKKYSNSSLHSKNEEIFPKPYLLSPL